MAKNKISEYSATSADNTDISNINIAEGCSPANVNNAIRTVMAQLKDFQSGNATYYTSNSDALAVGAGGTGAITAASARSNLSAASSGANSDITSLTACTTIIGLTTALSVAQGGTGVTTSTGTGAGVHATSPTLVTPVLGTPTSGTLTNCTGLPVAGGGTGASTLTSNNVILGNGTSAVQFVAPGTSGNVLTSNGTTWTSSAAFVAGMIMLWSGSSATIPSGWLLCNGASGTPDLRNRFVVGATSTYAVGATGGSADAIVVSHTHTATVTDAGHAHSLTNYGSAQAGSDLDGAPVMASTGYTTARNPNPTNSATTGITVANSTTGSSGTNANLPPYYALCYIMKS